MCASIPHKTRSELKVKWNTGKCRKKERVPALYRQTGRNQEIHLSFGLSQKVALNTLTARSSTKVWEKTGLRHCCAQSRASLERDHLALGAVTTWLAVATEREPSQLC